MPMRAQGVVRDARGVEVEACERESAGGESASARSLCRVDTPQVAVAVDAIGDDLCVCSVSVRAWGV